MSRSADHCGGEDPAGLQPIGRHFLNDRESLAMDHIDGPLVGGLVVLAAVADAKSFSKAAERLSMTQSGVSRAISRGDQ